MRIMALVPSLLAFIACALLGMYVHTHIEQPLLADWQGALDNHSTLVAWWCTWFGLPYILVPLCIASLLVTWRNRAWRTKALLAIVSLLASWLVDDRIQSIVQRPRPTDWVVKHETAFSYPSSHAAIAFGFYLLWAYWIATSDLPRPVRVITSALLVALVLAICWSRLALGAHWATDVLGGALLGSGITAIIMALNPAKVASPAGGPA